MELTYGTLRQSQRAAGLPVVPVSEVKIDEWVETGIICTCSRLPESAGRIPLPVRDGTESVSRMLLLPPAWVVETLGNTALALLELPGYAILWLMFPEPVFNELP